MKRVVLIASMLLTGCTASPDQPIQSSTTDKAELQVVLPDRKLHELAHEVAEEVDRKMIRQSNGILTRQPPPPMAEAYPNLRRDNLAFYDYVDDFNWYMNYLFSYTMTLNDYAVTRGWRSPKQVPICRIVNRRVMDELPKFEPQSDPSRDLSRFEWELVDYIKTIKDQYQDLTTELSNQQSTQRFLCIY